MADGISSGSGSGAATAAASPLPLCPSAELAERGRAYVWDVLEYGRAARAFALRIDGRVVAYMNRCLHVPTELDWQPGEFLDSERRFIICSIHGATYSPGSGQCVGGPCGRGRLQAVPVHEADGQVFWTPTRDIRAFEFEPSGPQEPSP
jgi:nitrite reductase/ring-hydroxylating ferredoxin subunit